MGAPVDDRHEAKNAPMSYVNRLEGGMKPGDSKDETGVKRLIRICRETYPTVGVAVGVLVGENPWLNFGFFTKFSPTCVFLFGRFFFLVGAKKMEQSLKKDGAAQKLM